MALVLIQSVTIVCLMLLIGACSASVSAHELNRHKPMFPTRVGQFERLGDPRMTGTYTTNVYVDTGDTVGRIRISYGKIDEVRSLGEILKRQLRAIQFQIFGFEKQSISNERIVIGGVVHEAVSAVYRRDFEGASPETTKQFRVVRNGKGLILTSISLPSVFRLERVERTLFRALNWGLGG